MSKQFTGWKKCKNRFHVFVMPCLFMKQGQEAAQYAVWGAVAVIEAVAECGVSDWSHDCPGASVRSSGLHAPPGFQLKKQRRRFICSAAPGQAASRLTQAHPAGLTFLRFLPGGDFRESQLTWHSGQSSSQGSTWSVISSRGRRFFSSDSRWSHI